MDYTALINFFGTQQRAATAIGVAQATVCRWHTLNQGRIPAWQQVRIERLTAGRLRADKALFPRAKRYRPVKAVRKAARAPDTDIATSVAEIN